MSKHVLMTAMVAGLAIGSSPNGTDNRLDQAGIALSSVPVPWGAEVQKAPSEEAERLLRLARRHLQAKRVIAAERAAEEAISHDPRRAEAWHLRGLARLRQGAVEEAIEAFVRTVQLDPRHAWAWNNLGYARLLADQWDEAARDLERARDLAPDLACVSENLGIAYEQTGRLSEAQLAWAKVMELAPDHPLAAASFMRISDALDRARYAEPNDGPASELDGPDSSPRSWLLEGSSRFTDDDPSGSDLRDGRVVVPTYRAAGRSTL